jgi:hypothetical protein
VRRAGLGDLVDEHVTVLTPVADMVTGVDTIDGIGLLRHGGMRRLFSGIRATNAP